MPLHRLLDPFLDSLDSTLTAAIIFLAIGEMGVIEGTGIFGSGSGQMMNWNSKAIWYTDEGYEICFSSERNWISYGPDGWVHLAISLDAAKQMCDSQEKVRTGRAEQS
jgi:hypothetical protein